MQVCFLCVCPGYLYCHGGTDRSSYPGSSFIPFSGYSCSPQLNSCCLSIIIIPYFSLCLSLPFPLLPVAFLPTFSSVFYFCFCFVIHDCCQLSCSSSSPRSRHTLHPTLGSAKQSLKPHVINKLKRSY